MVDTNALRKRFFGITAEDEMDMAKFKCQSMSMATFIDNLFPHIEEKWAKAQAGGKPYEIVYSYLENNTVKTTVYIFDNIEDKVRFSTELNLISIHNEKLFNEH